MKNYSRQIVCVLLLLVCTLASAMQSFKVAAIKVEGLHRIQYGTVLNYLPIQTGQTIDSSDTTNIIRALYKTGFFANVKLDKKGNTLIIHVKERPTIGYIQLTGKTSATKKTMLQSFKSVGLAEGQVFNRSTLDSVKESLQNRLYERGNYGALVETSVTPMSENRVEVTVHISEGKIAKIKEIRIIGNHEYSDWTLVNNMTLTSGRPWAVLTKQDEYSREKLDADIERLRSYYMDHGYLEFTVDSLNVSMTPNRKEVYIVIHITEGKQFHLSGYDVSGQTILPKEDLRKEIDLEVGEVFSRNKIANVNRKLGDYLANYGYAYPMIRPIPEVNQETKEVFVTFSIEPGKKHYVRNISFKGNSKTEDLVMRREMRQEEGAVASMANIKMSERRLNMLGYFKGVQLKTSRVPGVDDQVDLEFNVQEVPSAKFTAGAGYSVTQGLMLNFGFNQTNFLGTGKSIGINLNGSEFVRSFNFNYFNPYYTEDGLGRGFVVYATKSDFDKHDDVTDYTMDQYGAAMNYSLPLSENNNVQFGLGYQRTDLHIGRRASANLLAFEAENGENFQNAMLTSGWSFNTLDRAIMPTEGYAHNLHSIVGLPLTGDSQAYFKGSYSGHLYQPLGKGFILSLHGELGYGNGIFKTNNLPFYENFYAGGIGVQGSVRGYKGYSIGPKDSKGDTLGGNFLADGTVSLIIPQPFAEDALRSTVFVDFGNVYTNANLIKNPAYICTGEPSGPMRYSIGTAFEWHSPMGPLVISLAKPMNSTSCDRDDVFQFTIGASL